MENRRNRNITLAVSLVIGWAVAGLAIGRSISHQQRKFHGATIVYRLTEYDPDGKVLGVTNMTRFQWADGSWVNHQVGPTGKTRDSSGKIPLQGRPAPDDYWSRALSQGQRTGELLGTRIVIHPLGRSGERGEVWYSPDKEAMLKQISYGKDGTVSLILEAVEIRDGEPPPN